MVEREDAPTLERGGLSLNDWGDEAGIGLHRGRLSVHLSPDDLRWLIYTAGPAMLHAIGAVPQIRRQTTRACGDLAQPGPPTPPDEEVPRPDVAAAEPGRSSSSQPQASTLTLDGTSAFGDE